MRNSGDEHPPHRPLSIESSMPQAKRFQRCMVLPHIGAFCTSPTASCSISSAARDAIWVALFIGIELDGGHYVTIGVWGRRALQQRPAGWSGLQRPVYGAGGGLPFGGFLFS